MAFLSGVWLLPGYQPVPAVFRSDGMLQLGTDTAGPGVPKVIGYFRKVELSEQSVGILVAAKETEDVKDAGNLRPLLLEYIGQGVWRCGTEKRTVFVTDNPHQQVLNFAVPDTSGLSFRVVWCHPGQPPAAVWLRQDGKVEYNTDLCRRNVYKKNGGYVIKFAHDIDSGRLQDIQELEITFHYDGVESLAKTVILQPLNEVGVFRAVGRTRHGQRQHFESEWAVMQLKDWHIVAIVHPIVA